MNKIMETLNLLVSKAPSWLVLVMILCLGLSIGHDITGRTELSGYIEEMKQYKDSTKILLKRADSVKANEIRRDSVITDAVVSANEARAEAARIKATRPSPAVVAKLRSELDSLKGAISDSVEMARVIIPKQDSLIVKQDSTIRADSNIFKQNATEAGKLRFSLAEEIKSKDSFKNTAQELQNQLDKMPKTPKDPDKLFGLIKMPSRTTGAIVGFIGGVVTMIAISK
jgi:hypothetical protein